MTFFNGDFNRRRLNFAFINFYFTLISYLIKFLKKDLLENNLFILDSRKPFQEMGHVVSKGNYYDYIRI